MVVRVAIDAMGGDFAPLEIVKGGLLAARDLENVEIVLVGVAAEILKVASSLEKELGFSSSSKTDTDDLDLKLFEAKFASKTTVIKIYNAEEEIDMGEKNPAKAVRKAKKSSVVVANRLVAEAKADAVVAAGNTGAATAASLFELKRMPGFERPCICTVIPTVKGKMLLIDGGSNIETTAIQMKQSAILGSIMAENLLGMKKPRIGLLNIGEEPGKGIQLYKDAYDLLLAEARINFIGNVEGKTIINDICDVAICDGFTGNVHLKALEGGLKMFKQVLEEQIKATSVFAKVSGAIMKFAGVFQRVKEKFDPACYGGALLGGLNHVSLISHGSSNAEAIMNASKHAKLLVESRTLESIKENF